jgi:hypothetical protein
MRGTQTTSGLSRLQRLLLASTWIAGMLGILLLAPRIASEQIATGLVVGVLAVCWLLSYRITRRPAGAPRIQITSAEGLRGTFVVRQYVWYVLLVPASMLSVVAIITLGEAPRLAASPAAWILTAAGILVVIGGPLLLIFGRVRAFSVDASGQLWVRRWGRMVPLQLGEFRQVRGHVLRARGITVPTRVVCSGGAGMRRVVFPLDTIISVEHRTPVYAHVVDSFLRDACGRAGFTVRSLGRRGEQGWIAER